MNTHSTDNDPSEDTLDPIPLGRALAIGPCGPPWTLPSKLELAVQAEAEALNFNPYHDELGRFTTSAGAVGPQGGHQSHHQRLAQRKGPAVTAKQKGASQDQVGSIARHPYDSRNFARCVLASIRTMIAAMKEMEAPSEAAIQAQLEAEAGRYGLKIYWGVGTNFRNDYYAAIVQKVLKENGVESSYRLEYGSMDDLAKAIMDSKKPAMLNIALAGHKDEHSVTVQWNPDAAGKGDGRFLINNISAKGESRQFTQEDFKSGKITSDIKENGSIQDSKMRTFSVEKGYAVIIAKSR